MADSYYDKMADEEAYWKSQETEWLEKLKKTSLYSELLEEFEENSLKSGLEMIVKTRSRYYRYGPRAVEEEKKLVNKFEKDASYFLEEILEKKYYDACLSWMIGDLNLTGIFSFYQLTICKGSLFNCPFISKVQPEEVDFIRQLLKDEDYIRSKEFPKYDSWIPDPEDIYDWQNERNESEEFPENYPVFFRKYDQWFNKVNRLQAPLLRYEKFLNYRKKAIEKRNAEKPAVTPDPEMQKPSYIEFEEMEKICAEWFKKFEPVKMQTLFAANEKFAKGESVLDNSHFYDVMDALNESFVKPYPDPTLEWHEALNVEGRRIWFRNISDALNMAYKAYGSELENKKSLELTEAAEWITQSGFNENEQKIIFEGQRILGEPENLNY